MSNRGLSDRDLNVPFVDKEQLAENETPFMLSDYSERESRYEGNTRLESVFTIYLIEGPERGYDQLLTFSKTEARARLGKLVLKTGTRGPAMLVKVKKDKDGKKLANPRYEFRPVDDDKVIEKAEKLVQELRRGVATEEPADEDAKD